MYSCLFYNMTAVVCKSIIMNCVCRVPKRKRNQVMVKFRPADRTAALAPAGGVVTGVGHVDRGAPYTEPTDYTVAGCAISQTLDVDLRLTRGAQRGVVKSRL